VLGVAALVIVVLALTALFFGDWSGGSPRASLRQARVKRGVLIAAAVLVVGFVVLVWLSGGLPVI